DPADSVKRFPEGRGIPLYVAPCRGWPRQPGRLRPKRSWLDTQSPERIAEESEMSPASATAAQISASLSALPAPWQPSIARHSLWVASPVPPPTVATIRAGRVIDQ